MLCDLNYRQGEGALEGLEKDGEPTFQRTGQRQGCEKTGNMSIYSRKKKKCSKCFTFPDFNIVTYLSMNSCETPNASAIYCNVKERYDSKS